MFPFFEETFFEQVTTLCLAEASHKNFVNNVAMTAWMLCSVEILTDILNE
jgi:hypothetical protein